MHCIWGHVSSLAGGKPGQQGPCFWPRSAQLGAQRSVQEVRMVRILPWPQLVWAVRLGLKKKKSRNHGRRSRTRQHPLPPPPLEIPPSPFTLGFSWSAAAIACAAAVSTTRPADLLPQARQCSSASRDLRPARPRGAPAPPPRQRQRWRCECPFAVYGFCAVPILYLCTYPHSTLQSLAKLSLVQTLHRPIFMMILIPEYSNPVMHCL
jgi:hypothetical protein